MAESWNDMNEVVMAIAIEADRLESKARMTFDQALGKSSYGDMMDCTPIEDEEALKFLRRMAGIMIKCSTSLRKLQEIADFAVEADEMSWKN